MLHIIGYLKQLTTLSQTSRDPECLIVNEIHPLPHVDDLMVLEVDAAYELVLALNVEDALEELDGVFLLHVGHANDRN